MNNLVRLLRIAPVRKSEHLLFNLFEFRFFRDSERGVALPFGSLRFLSLSILVSYVLEAELIFFRTHRFFVKARENVVSLVALREESNSLFIASIGVAKEYRRLGVATIALRYTERLAARLGKEWLELSVLKGNVPAQRLYAKIGFTRKKVGRWSFILRKKVALP
jgi:ribosomal protein S18 acetylase RimI-like enzyme